MFEVLQWWGLSSPRAGAGTEPAWLRWLFGGWSRKEPGDGARNATIALMHGSVTVCRLRLHPAVHGALKLGPINMVIFVCIDFTALK